MFDGQGDEAGSPEPDWDVSWEAVEGEFIVRFREYRMAAEHRAALEAGLRPDAAGWQWVERHNQAAQHPTDFGLLRISLADVEAVKVRDPVGCEVQGGQEWLHSEHCAALEHCVALEARLDTGAAGWCCASSGEARRHPTDRSLLRISPRDAEAS